MAGLGVAGALPPVEEVAGGAGGGQRGDADAEEGPALDVVLVLELTERLREVEADVLLTAEAKSMPLVYEMSALMGLPYVVLRKSYKSYMGDALSADTVSITTGKKQTLYLDEKDFPRLRGKRAIIIDDVVSTGSTLEGMQEIVRRAGGTVAKIAAVFTEGQQDWDAIVCLGNLPVFIDEG